MNNDVLYLRLINGEQVAGRFLKDDEDTLWIEFPMYVENQEVNGTLAVNLIRYLPFSGETEQILSLQKNHIVALVPVTTEFCNYYYNSVHYHMIYIQPQTQLNMSKVNANLQAVLSKDNQDFMDAMKKHQFRIPDQLSTKVH